MRVCIKVYQFFWRI